MDMTVPQNMDSYQVTEVEQTADTCSRPVSEYIRQRAIPGRAYESTNLYSAAINLQFVAMLR